jgi:predicted peptidase
MMLKRLTLAMGLMAAILVARAGVAQADWETLKQGSTQYRLFTPDKYDAKQKYPLVVVLHSAGWRGKGLDNLAKLPPSKVLSSEKVQKDNPCFVLVPYCEGKDQWVNLPWKNGSYSVDKVAISQPLQNVLDAVAALRARASVDAERLYVVGGSMGGYGTWDVICRNPDTWAAAVPIAGAGDPSAAAKLKGVGIWAFHGEKDNIIPVAGTKDMVAAIEKAGGEIKTTLVDKGHLWEQPWDEQGDELVKWLFGHKRTAIAPASSKPATQPASQPASKPAK